MGFSIAQICISVLLVASVLLQAQGTGLGGAWAQGGETFHTRRGLEKVVFIATIVLVGLFSINSIILLTLARS